jgi:predicted dehydrogenase
MPGRRAIVVGAGGISHIWFKALAAEEVSVAAVVDLNEEAAATRIAEYELRGARASTDLASVLAEVEADFVLDLTVPAAHEAVTCAALEAGLPVLGEKPMADSMDAARRMVETADRAGKLYMVSQSRRYNPRHQAIARTVATGRLGELTAAHCDFFLGAHFSGFRARMKHVLLVDMAIHHFDMARLFTATDPISVFAEEFNPAGSWCEHGAAAHCLFEMTGGLRLTYRGSWVAEGCSTGWEANWRLIGSCGSLVYERGEPPHGEIVTAKDGFLRPAEKLAIEPEIESPTGWQGALREFLAALDGKGTPQGECHDNIKSLAMVFAAIHSAETGQRIPIEI